MSKLIQMHAADHLLAVALKKRYPNIRAKSFQLGEEKTRAVYESSQPLTEQIMKEMEEEVNNYIKQNLEITDETISKQEAEKICDICLIPPSVKEVRIVKIGNISCEACIGEHIKNTSEMGKFKVLNIKKDGKNTYKINFTIID